MYIFSKAFLLFAFISKISSQFTSEPGEPELGESIFLKCRLNAPENQRFVDITAELRINSSAPFTCGDLSDRIGNSRFQGMHKPDEDLKNLRCDVFIFFLQESDFGITLTCSQKLENQTLLQYHYTLTRGGSTPQTTSPKTTTFLPITSQGTTTFLPITSQGTTTFPTTTLEPQTCNNSFTTPETQTDDLIVSSRAISIATLFLVCFIFVLLCLTFIVFAPINLFILLYILYNKLYKRRRQHYLSPEIPKSKKKADNDQLQDNAIELQELSISTAQEDTDI